MVQGLTWCRNSNGSPQFVRKFPEAASQTFKAGQILVWDTSDEAVKLATVTTVAAIGIALEDASGTTGNEVHVQLIRRGDIYSVSVCNDGATDDSDTAFIGIAYGWKASTQTGETAKICLDTNNTTNDWLTVLDLDPRDPDGTTDGRVLVEFLATVTEPAQVA